MKSIKIAENLSLPAETSCQTLAILAKRRSGKSYLARRIAEQLFHTNQQFALIDPKGDQWGIRSAANGKDAGLPIPIFGGEHGDAPLEVGSGEIIAKLIVEEGVSVLIDLSMFRKSEVAVFMSAFLETIYRLKAKEEYRTPLMLVTDEGDAIAPQRPMHGEERMLGAMEDIVRRGGQRGIGSILITQRSAVLNKNVLTQAQILIALRLIAPQDLKAMDAWIEVHGTQEQRRVLMESLPSLPVGDAWFWSPGWPTNDGIFKRVHVLPIETFDSGATPKPGERHVIPKTLADIDINVLKRRMASTIEKAKADDPKELKKKIRELEAKLATPVAKESIRVETKEIKVPIISAQDRKILTRAIETISKLVDGLTSTSEVLLKSANSITTALNFREQIIAPTPLKISIANLPKQITATPHTRGIRLDGVIDENKDKQLGAGERKILTAIAGHEGGMTRQHITVLTGYKRSSRDTYLQRLRASGCIDISGDRIFVTQRGIEELGDDMRLPLSGLELQREVLSRLPSGERKILEIMIQAYPGAVLRDDISEKSGYQRSSRDTYLQRLNARELIVFNGPGSVVASEKLF